MNIQGSTENKDLLNGAIFESPYTFGKSDKKDNDFREAILQSLSDVSADLFDRVILNIETEDGECAYGIEKVNFLDSEHLAVGMLGGIHSHVWETSPSEDEDIADYLISDIVMALGEKFTCQFSYENWG